jgi:hypothetical protein
MLRQSFARGHVGHFAMREAAGAIPGSTPLPAEGLRRTALELSAALGVGLLLAAFGPYGTFGQAPLAERLVYWIAVILIAFAIYRPACAAAESFAHRIGLSAGFAWTAAVVAASFPVTLLVWLASFRHTPALWPSFSEYVGFYGSVIVIGAGLMMIIWLVDQANAHRVVHQAAVVLPAIVDVEAATPVRPRLANRLPPKLGDEIVALQMEDHYVRVHTRLGNSLLLMRMRDSVTELDRLEGAQVHRSWWVAREAVASVEREGRRTALTLTNGLRVPVSRERRDVLPGWLLELIG